MNKWLLSENQNPRPISYERIKFIILKQIGEHSNIDIREFEKYIESMDLCRKIEILKIVNDLCVFSLIYKIKNQQLSYNLLITDKGKEKLNSYIDGSIEHFYKNGTEKLDYFLLVDRILLDLNKYLIKK